MKKGNSISIKLTTFLMQTKCIVKFFDKPQTDFKKAVIKLQRFNH